MITAKDVAAKLQVSTSTVGRALADDPRISAAMKQRVTAAAQELGYVANHAARMMRGVSSKLVGLVVPDIRNSFYSTTAHALSRCLEAAGFQLTLSETDDDRARELRQLRELSSANVAGIIIVPSARPQPESVRLLSLTPHIQLLRRHAALGDRWFGIDDVQALQQATQHVLELGHERIAYVGGSAELPTGQARLKGFQAALAGHRAARLALEDLGPPSSMEFGRDALRRLLERPQRPTAIITGSVQITQGILEECLQCGLRVPEDMSIVGFGDEPGFRWWGPGLTTMALPVSELATACGLWFVHQLTQKPAQTGPYSSVSPAKLVVRGSTGRVAPSPAPVARKRAAASRAG
ncbi:MAG: LacI family transcriptional regulator [Comamonadaceae bacterium]|nr:MAG: LacI family transcriptional regulator [Comamonadaceae bacterium]